MHGNIVLVLDAVKRRTLPAWIREGLEKMDREKQKKLEKERMEKERAEMAINERNSDMVEEEGDGPRLPRKSKFVSIFFRTCLQRRNLLRLLWQLLSQGSLTCTNVHLHDHYYLK